MVKYMKYDSLNDVQKIELIKKEYNKNNKSFGDIALEYHTYANKIRRDALKFGIKIRDKSEAQKNALKTGKTNHPTKGKNRTESTKEKIGNGVMKSWERLDSSTLEQRKQKARDNWENLSEDKKQEILQQANSAVRVASKQGSKLELFLLEKLIQDGYKVDFHKEQSLSNTKLQIDLFLPTLNIAIEVDGPSHSEPVWGEEALKRNITYDNKKSGLILGKGLVLIRIKQNKDFSKSKGNVIYRELKQNIQYISQHFPKQDNRTIIIGE